MRHGATIRRFTAPLAVLAVLLIVPAADAVSLARQCRQACGDEIAACVAAGGRQLACKRQTLRRCRREGLAVCQGPSAGGNVTPVTAPLRTPTSLKASARSAGEIDLSWNDTNSQEMGYLIERSLDSASGFVQIAAVGINAHFYKNFSLGQTTTYYYQVRAFGSTNPASGVTDAFSPYSNIFGAATPADMRAPSVPSQLNAWAVQPELEGLDGWRYGRPGIQRVSGERLPEAGAGAGHLDPGLGAAPLDDLFLCRLGRRWGWEPVEQKRQRERRDAHLSNDDDQHEHHVHYYDYPGPSDHHLDDHLHDDDHAPWGLQQPQRHPRGGRNLQRHDEWRQLAGGQLRQLGVLARDGLPMDPGGLGHSDDPDVRRRHELRHRPLPAQRDVRERDRGLVWL